MKRNLILGVGIMLTIILFVTELYCQKRYPRVLPEKGIKTCPEPKTFCLSECFSKRLSIAAGNMDIKAALHFIESCFNNKECPIRIETKNIDRHSVVWFNAGWPDSVSVIEAVDQVIRNTPYKMAIDADNNTILIIKNRF